ncbi:STAS domain-containing protein [Streptomyces sp. MS1.HAVA.3]|uniref:Anti-sigma factor antagonist n=1 Tax=Streptomyces caledonius TaxID=3134107 RepID=A0ABU8UC89_9ACTN
MIAPFDRTPVAAGADGATAHRPTVAVEVAYGPHRVLARVRGEIDLDHVSALRQDLVAALDAGGSGIDLDLSAVTFCDSSGLHLLLALNTLAADAGKTLVLTAVSRRVARVLEITEAERLFTFREPPPLRAGPDPQRAERHHLHPPNGAVRALDERQPHPCAPGDGGPGQAPGASGPKPDRARPG